jgi:hypothetical protein
MGDAKKRRRNLTVAESKKLKKGDRVFWRGDAADGGNYQRDELERGHNRLGQWSSRHREPWGHAGNPLNIGKAKRRLT